MNTIQSNSLLSEKETAALLHISPRKLQDDRANRRGLPYTRIVRKIFYDRKAIEIYLRETLLHTHKKRAHCGNRLLDLLHVKN